MTRKAEGAAEQELRAKGLDVAIAKVPSTRGPAGLVVDQTPNPGTSVRAKVLVTLQVPNPPPDKAVPHVIGLPYATARSELTAAGFGTVLKIEKQHSIQQTKLQGTVLIESPLGAQLPGTKITLTVMSGAAGTPVPNVSGQSVAEASATLTRDGFAVNPNPTQALSKSIPAGDVISTNPPAGSKQLLGVTITLTEAENSTTVPDLLGESVSQAEQTLYSDHLVPGLVRVVPPTRPGCAGYVCYTNPASGQTVNWYTKVGIFEGTPPVPPTTATLAPTTTVATSPTGLTGNSGAGATGGTTGSTGSGVTGNTGSGATGNTGSGATGSTGSGTTGNSGSGATGTTGPTTAGSTGPTAGGTGVTGASSGGQAGGSTGATGATSSTGATGTTQATAAAAVTVVSGPAPGPGNGATPPGPGAGAGSTGAPGQPPPGRGPAGQGPPGRSGDNRAHGHGAGRHGPHAG